MMMKMMMMLFQLTKTTLGCGGPVGCRPASRCVGVWPLAYSLLSYLLLTTLKH